MKLLWMIIPLLAITAFTSAFASPLENQELRGESSAVSIDIKFGEDDVRFLPFEKAMIIPTLDEVTLNFYGDVIDLSDSEVRVSSTGKHFRISNQDLGIIIYAHFNDGPKTYKIDLYLVGDEGFTKYTIPTTFHIEQDVTIIDGAITTKIDPASIKEQTLGINYYMNSVQFIQQDFTIQVKAFDSAKSVGGLLNNAFTLEDVNIKIVLEQNKREWIRVDGTTIFETIIEDEWEVIHSIEGNTNSHGDWTGAKLLTSGVFEPKQWMRVTITATLDDQVFTEQVNVFVTEFGAK